MLQETLCEEDTQFHSDAEDFGLSHLDRPPPMTRLPDALGSTCTLQEASSVVPTDVGIGRADGVESSIPEDEDTQFYPESPSPRVSRLRPAVPLFSAPVFGQRVDAACSQAPNPLADMDAELLATQSYPDSLGADDSIASFLVCPDGGAQMHMDEAASAALPSDNVDAEDSIAALLRCDESAADECYPPTQAYPDLDPSVAQSAQMGLQQSELPNFQQALSGIPVELSGIGHNANAALSDDFSATQAYSAGTEPDLDDGPTMAYPEDIFMAEPGVANEMPQAMRSHDQARSLTWTCHSCGESNKFSRDACNCCSAARPADVMSDTGSAQATKSHEQEISVGPTLEYCEEDALAGAELTREAPAFDDCPATQMYSDDIELMPALESNTKHKPSHPCSSPAKRAIDIPVPKFASSVAMASVAESNRTSATVNRADECPLTQLYPESSTSALTPPVEEYGETLAYPEELPTEGAKPSKVNDVSEESYPCTQWYAEDAHQISCDPGVAVEAKATVEYPEEVEATPVTEKQVIGDINAAEHFLATQMYTEDAHLMNLERGVAVEAKVTVEYRNEAEATPVMEKQAIGDTNAAEHCLATQMYADDCPTTQIIEAKEERAEVIVKPEPSAVDKRIIHDIAGAEFCPATQMYSDGEHEQCLENVKKDCAEVVEERYVPAQRENVADDVFATQMYSEGTESQEPRLLAQQQQEVQTSHEREHCHSPKQESTTPPKLEEAEQQPLQQQQPPQTSASSPGDADTVAQARKEKLHVKLQKLMELPKIREKQLDTSVVFKALQDADGSVVVAKRALLGWEQLPAPKLEEAEQQPLLQQLQPPQAGLEQLAAQQPQATPQPHAEVQHKRRSTSSGRLESSGGGMQQCENEGQQTKKRRRWQQKLLSTSELKEQIDVREANTSSALLEGAWLDSSGNRVDVAAGKAVWDDGSTSVVECLGDSEFRMELQGNYYSAQLRGDSQLAWSDGDTWTRQPPIAAQTLNGAAALERQASTNAMGEKPTAHLREPVATPLRSPMKLSRSRSAGSSSSGSRAFHTTIDAALVAADGALPPVGGALAHHVAAASTPASAIASVPRGRKRDASSSVIAAPVEAPVEAGALIFGKRSRIMEAMAAEAKTRADHLESMPRTRLKGKQPPLHKNLQPSVVRVKSRAPVAVTEARYPQPEPVEPSIRAPVAATEAGNPQSGPVELLGQPCFAVTGASLSAQERQLIHQLGGKVADTWCPEVTHLITDKFRRTNKLMCAICVGAHIVTPGYLSACASQGSFVSEKAYMLRNDDAELVAFSQKRDINAYSLRAACDIARHQPLLEGLGIAWKDSGTVSSVQLRDMETLVKAAGGKWLVDGASPADDASVREILNLGETYDPELLREAACTQVLRYDRYRL